MKEIIIKLTRQLTVPVDASCISPDLLVGKTNREIQTLELWEGNRKVQLCSIFDVDVNSDAPSNELKIRIHGDLEKVRRIGHGMTSGTIEAEGCVGMHLGEEMSGGQIVVHGNAGSWVGSRMKGGRISIHGNAGDFVGSAYRGSRLGMKGGIVAIEGNVGVEMGCWMKGGTIIVKGNSGMFPGIHMNDGTILIEGDCEDRAGAQMTGGKIVILGTTPSILPSFSFDELREKVKVEEQRIHGPFYSFVGDVTETGKGRLFVKASSNPQLKWCEAFIQKPEE